MKFLGPVLATLVATACVIRLDANDGSFDETTMLSQSLPEGLRDLSLTVPAGDIRIVAGAELGVDATLHWQSGDDQPRIVANEDTTTASQTWRCRSKRSCQVDLVVTVPEDMDRLSIELEAGNIDLEGLSGRVLVQLEAGDVDVISHTGDLDVTIEAGSMAASDLDASDVRSSVEAGSIDLEFDVRPTSIDLETSAGDIDVEVPGGSYALDLSTNLGRVDVLAGITEDAGADATIVARVDVGAIRIAGS